MPSINEMSNTAYNSPHPALRSIFFSQPDSLMVTVQPASLWQ